MSEDWTPDQLDRLGEMLRAEPAPKQRGWVLCIALAAVAVVLLAVTLWAATPDYSCPAGQLLVHPASGADPVCVATR